MDNQISVIQKKICLLGDYSIGKTSLVRRFVYNLFDERYFATIGVNICRKEITISTQSLLNLVIWDLASNDKYQDLRSHYLQGTAGALLVCDLTRPETIELLKTNYIDQLKKNSPDALVIIVGNKCDLVNPDDGSISKVEQLAVELNAPHIITSAKTGENVEAAFLLLAEKLQKLE